MVYKIARHEKLCSFRLGMQSFSASAEDAKQLDEMAEMGASQSLEPLTLLGNEMSSSQSLEPFQFLDDDDAFEAESHKHNPPQKQKQNR